MDRFVWQPGTGCDGEALARLRDHFKRPKQPMGEAWFMTEKRRMFHELEGDLSALSIADLKAPLEDIASGTGSFGPMPEWNEWYHYLLGELIPRGHETFISPLFELLITGFIALHPSGVGTPPYRGFRDDVLTTLGRCIMDAQGWNGTDIVVGKILHRSNNNPARIWGWWDASGDLSASLFLCLKYLPDALVQEWFRSVLAIPSAHWRAQIIVWLVGAHDILTGQARWPSEFSSRGKPSVEWDWSHCLRPLLVAPDGVEGPAMLSDNARSQVLDVAKAYFTTEVYFEWLDSIATVPYVEAEYASAPSAFEALYVNAR